MLKFWLAEFAYALHLFNQAKGGLNFNDPRGITAMYKNVKRRTGNPGRDVKTLQEFRNHPRSLLTPNNTFIAKRAKHLEQIAAEFNKVYGCASNLTRDQVAVPELVSVIILMKQIRNILLYSRIRNDQPTSLARSVADDIVDGETEHEASSEEARSEEDILKELQSKIENLQSELTTKTTTMVTKRIHQIQAEITDLENKINKITRSIVPENLQEDLINSQQAIEDLIDLQEETRGLFGTNAEQRREAFAAQRQDNSISPIQTNQEVVPVYVTPTHSPLHSPPRWGPPLDVFNPVLETVTEGLRTKLRNASVGSKKRKLHNVNNGNKSRKKGGTIKNKRRTQKRITSRRRKTTKRLMSRRKRYTRKQKK